MPIMNINLFSMKLKRMMDVVIILPDEIKEGEKLSCVWCCHQNKSALDWLCYTPLVNDVNKKHFAAVIPEIFEDNLQKDVHFLKELKVNLQNMFVCISTEEKDNFFDEEYYLEYEKKFDYTYNKL